MIYEFHVKMDDESELDELTRILIIGWVIYESVHKKHINVVVAV